VRLDPAGLQVLIARLSGVATEMGAVLQRAAFSPNIKERADCSAAVFDPDGQLLAQAEHIPVHLGSMPASVAAVLARFAADPLRPGEQAVVNDPYAGGTHLNDLTVVAPCHVDGRIVGYVANRAHHADLGGAAPGSLPADATDIAQEGLRLPPVRLTAEVRDLIVASSRTPGERAGDLDAQLGANVVGCARLAALDGQPFAEVLDYGERRVLAALADLGAGAWRAEDRLDSTGPRPEQQHPARICCRITSTADAVTFDFTGTDPQSTGNVNAVEAVTTSCVAFALRAALDPSLPANAGVMRRVRVVAPLGSLVNARFPAAVGAGNVEVSQRIADVCLRAFANAVPRRVGAASQGTMNNVVIGGRTDRAGGDGPWVYYETVGGGQGGRPGDRPGMSGVHTGMTNTRTTPVEALERAYPLRVRRSTLRRGSGGEGAAPGGDGIEREIELLTDATVSVITERRTSTPWGLDGGAPGAAGENVLLDAGARAPEALPDKCTVHLHAGAVLALRTPGGGGHGASGSAAAPRAEAEE
jgi:N-methylhydantoinase B/oxoprolinase/acetone carboxylase alpha subunit